MAVAVVAAAAVGEGLTWFIVIAVAEVMVVVGEAAVANEERGWENEGLGVSTSARDEKPATTAEASCNIVGVNGGDRQGRKIATAVLTDWLGCGGVGVSLSPEWLV